MSSSQVAFLDPYGNPNSGVDHLGMRVAGEAAYSKLIDFITTVAWRPRYFSFLSWALQYAWEASSKKSKDGVIKVNKTLQRSILKRLDYTIAASTLLSDRGAQRIAGSEAINKAIDGSMQSTIMIKEDHLRNSVGSYNIYAGSMRGLGLVETASNVDRPSEVGMKIANLYKESLGNKEDVLISAAKDKAVFSFDEIKTLAKIAGLTGFNNDDMPNEVVNEKLALRKILFGATAPLSRRLSAGIILHAHKLLQKKVNLDEFRSLTLLKGIQTENGNISFILPESYELILPHWGTYQAHAFAIYALESLLSIILDHAQSLEDNKGEGVDCGQLLNFMSGEIVNDNNAIAEDHGDMNSWIDLDVKSLRKLLFKHIEKEFEAELCEPILYDTLKSRPSSVSISLMLFLFSIARLEFLNDQYGDKAWIGSKDPFRLPPKVLINDFLKAANDGTKVIEYARQILMHYVIKQHHQNAMRKLVAVPELDTSKFSWEGNRLVPIGSHKAGTSNPRFDNAVFCLTDLGYLDNNGKVTSDGFTFLNEIES